MSAEEKNPTIAEWAEVFGVRTVYVSKWLGLEKDEPYRRVSRGELVHSFWGKSQHEGGEARDIAHQRWEEGVH